jgi:hypothetical protein
MFGRQSDHRDGAIDVEPQLPRAQNMRVSPGRRLSVLMEPAKSDHRAGLQSGGSGRRRKPRKRRQVNMYDVQRTLCKDRAVAEQFDRLCMQLCTSLDA